MVLKNKEVNEWSRIRFALLSFGGTAAVIALAMLISFALSGADFRAGFVLASLIGGIVGAVAVGAIYLALTRTVFRRAVIERDMAQRITHELKRAGEGDLSVDWDDIVISVNGERQVIPFRQVHERLVGVLVESDRMSGQLNRLAHEILDQAVKLSEGAREQSTSVSESTSSVGRIHSTIREVSSNIESLAELSVDVSSSTYEMIASIEEVSNNSQKLNSAMDETAATVTQIVGNIHSVAESTDSLSMATIQSHRSMEDIDRSTRIIRDRAEEAAGLTNKAREGAEHSKELLGRTVDGIRDLAGTIESTRQVMKKLGVQSRSIGEILTVISSVAADTHLLSLNASIMAAKAGEHGRGFAVVAQEIKTLAQRTAASAKEIENLITGTQDSVDRAIDAIEQGTSKVSEGMRLSEEADLSLAEVLDRAEIASRNSRDIAKLTYDQAEVSQEVFKAVDEVARRTELIQTAMREQEDSSEFVRKRVSGTQDLTMQVAKAMKEQAESSRRISMAMERLTTSIEGIKLATDEQALSSSGIVRAIDTIRRKADLVAISAQNVSNTSMSVLHQSLLLHNELKGIRLPVREARYTLGLLFDNLREERWKREREFFITRAQELGAKVEFRVADGDAERQVEFGRELIEAGVDLMIVVAVDAVRAGAIVEASHAAGVPVIAYDRLIKDCELDLFVSFNAARIGSLQAEAAMKRPGKNRIFILAGSPTDVNSHMLYNGQMKLLKPAAERGEVDIVGEVWVPDWDPEQAYRLTKETIRQHKNLDAVVASNDGTAGGAIRALAELVPERKVVVTGMDTELSACRRIVEGSQTMTVYMPIRLQASRAMEAALLTLRGEEIPEIDEYIDNGRVKVPSILLQPIRVDAENLEEVVIKGGFHKREDVFRKKS